VPNHSLESTSDHDADRQRPPSIPRSDLGSPTVGTESASQISTESSNSQTLPPLLENRRTSFEVVVESNKTSPARSKTNLPANLSLARNRNNLLIRENGDRKRRRSSASRRAKDTLSRDRESDENVPKKEKAYAEPGEEDERAVKIPKGNQEAKTIADEHTPTETVGHSTSDDSHVPMKGVFICLFRSKPGAEKCGQRIMRKDSLVRHIVNKHQLDRDRDTRLINGFIVNGKAAADDLGRKENYGQNENTGFVCLFLRNKISGFCGTQIKNEVTFKAHLTGEHNIVEQELASFCRGGKLYPGQSKKQLLEKYTAGLKAQEEEEIASVSASPDEQREESLDPTSDREAQRLEAETDRRKRIAKELDILRQQMETTAKEARIASEAAERTTGKKKRAHLDQKVKAAEKRAQKAARKLEKEVQRQRRDEESERSAKYAVDEVLSRLQESVSNTPMIPSGQPAAASETSNAIEQNSGPSDEPKGGSAPLESNDVVPDRSLPLRKVTKVPLPSSVTPLTSAKRTPVPIPSFTAVNSQGSQSPASTLDKVAKKSSPTKIPVPIPGSIATKDTKMKSADLSTARSDKSRPICQLSGVDGCEGYSASRIDSLRRHYKDFHGRLIRKNTPTASLTVSVTMRVLKEVTKLFDLYRENYCSHSRERQWPRLKVKLDRDNRILQLSRARYLRRLVRLLFSHQASLYLEKKRQLRD
jgi:hypothetical protein